MAPLRQRTPYYSVASYVVGIPARLAASTLHVDSGYRIGKCKCTRQVKRAGN